MVDICKEENASPEQVFSILYFFFSCCPYRNLWLAVICCQKPKIENDAFDYRFVV